VSPTIEPGPPPRVARTDPFGLSKPLERFLRLAEIQVGEADFLVGLRLARIFHDDRVGGDDGVVEPALCAAQRGLRLQGH
jgi:hypothetical protein